MPGTKWRDEEVEYRILSVAWSPSGSDLAVAGHAFTPAMIAAIDKAQLFLVHPDGAHQRRIGALVWGWTERLSWRPDGTKVLLSQYYKQTASSVKAIDVATGASSDIQGNAPGLQLTFADWSPDGRSIAAGCDSDTHMGGPADLVVFAALNGKRTTVLKVDRGLSWVRLYPSWSPDGQWLAYAVEDGIDHGDAADPSLELVALTGGSTRVVARNADQPAWRPTASPPMPTPTAAVTLTLSGLTSGAVRLGQTVTATGAVTPISLAGIRVVLSVQMKTGVSWTKVKTTSASSRPVGNYRWKYAPAAKGAYRMRTQISATATYPAATTPWRAFTVK